MWKTPSCQNNLNYQYRSIHFPLTTTTMLLKLFEITKLKLCVCWAQYIKKENSHLLFFDNPILRIRRIPNVTTYTVQNNTIPLKHHCRQF